MLRGGSWNNKPRNLRTANRNRNDPSNRNDNNGFRLGVAPQDSQKNLPRCRPFTERRIVY